MRITKKNRNRKSNTNLNIENNLNDDINDKIKIIENEINQINFTINKKETDIKNNISNNGYYTILQELKKKFSNINIKLNEIMNIFNNKNKKIKSKTELFKIENNEKINIIPIKYQKDFIIEDIEKLIILPLNNHKKRNIKRFSRNSGLPLIKKNIIYQIKKVEEFEILKNKKINNENFRNKNYENNSLSINKRPFICQNINNLFIPNIENENNELLSIILPIPEFFIEENDNFMIYCLEKPPFTIQYNLQMEYKPQQK